jgi:hypothetical protein
MRLFIYPLGITAAFILWFCSFQDGSAAALSQRATDLLDSRPARSILIVGNSRTFRNDMPAMLREIADSAGSPTKLQIESSTYPGASFKTHWENRRTRRLLGAGWDDIILQPESAAQAWRQGNKEFLLYGPKLAEAGKVRQGRPRLIVGWPYDSKIYDDPDLEAVGFGRAEHLALLKEMPARLASEANLGRINVVGPWEALRLSHPSIKLTVDGNHPSVSGTYLYALAVYAALSNGPMASVTYVPDGLQPADAKAIRDTVDSIPLMP